MSKVTEKARLSIESLYRYVHKRAPAREQKRMGRGVRSREDAINDRIDEKECSLRPVRKWTRGGKASVQKAGNRALYRHFLRRIHELHGTPLTGLRA